MTEPNLYLRDTTGGSTWGDPSLTSRDQFIDYQMFLAAQCVIPIDDVSELPADAHIRANGVFTDVEDLIEYLERGGLVIPLPEGDPEGTYAPVGFVYATATQMPDGTFEYQVYIRDDSD